MLISLWCAHGTAVVAEGGGFGQVNANRNAIGPWETFGMGDAAGVLFDIDAAVGNNSVVTLRTSGGQFLFPQWGRKVLANAATPAGAGFQLVILAGAIVHGRSAPITTIALRSLRKYSRPGGGSEYYWVTAESQNPRPLVATRQSAQPGAWEKFDFWRFG